MSVLNRRVEVALGQAGQTGRALTDLRVRFTVDMSKGSSAHTATIRIWNAAPSTLAILEGGDAPTVQLKAGYGDPLQPDGGSGVPRTLFTGQVIRDGLRMTRPGTDRIAILQAQDSPGVYESSGVRLRYTRPVPFEDVVRAVSDSLGLPVGTISLPTNPTLEQGGVFEGSAREILDDLASSTESSWWVSDGLLYFAPDTEGVEGFAPLFSSDARNLIGEPTKKDRGRVEARALLDASMRPGRPFALQSRTITGDYIAEDVRFDGDSWEGPWHVIVTGRPAA